MVGMFMGDHNGQKVIRRQIALTHPPLNFTTAQTGIHKERSATCRDMDTIALAAAGQHAQRKV
jgi:hypothetical protein